MADYSTDAEPQRSDDSIHTGITPEEDARTVMANRVSWGAIFAGVVCAMVVQVLLTLLGVGIGLPILDPGPGDSPEAGTSSIVAAVWFILAGIVAAFVGGYIAARLSGKTVETSGALHGLTTWAVTTLLTIYLLTTAVGSIVGGALTGIAGTVGGLGSTVAQTAAPALSDVNPLQAIEREVRSLRASGQDPQVLMERAVSAVTALVTAGESEKAAARQRAVRALAGLGVPAEEARTAITRFERQYDQTVEQATQAASAAASAASVGALSALVALVLGAVAGWFGGRSGVVHPRITGRRLPRRREA